MKKIVTLTLLAFVLFTPHLHADEITTDRPDAAESSVTVGKYRFQSEHGFSIGYDDPAGPSTRTYTFPTLLRFGILEDVELRLETEIASIQSSVGTTTRGFTDIDLGAKWHAFDQSKALPSLALLAHLTLPVGKDSLSANVVVPTVKALADWDLPKGFAIGSNAGFDLPAREGGDKFARFLYAISLSHSLFVEELGGFLEFAGVLPMATGKLHEHFFDCGLTYLLKENIQADISSQIALNETAQDFSLGFGLSILW